MNEELSMCDDGLSSAARQRRQFILAAATAVVGVSLAKELLGSVADSDFLKRVLQALGHADEVVESTAQLDARLARVLREPCPADRREFMDARYLKQRIKDNIEADYRDGAVRVIDGWWLSNTEAECLELIAQSSSA